MNVYVPPDLRERMRKFDAVINWSQVAVSAFEAAIKEHIALVDERLRRLRYARTAQRWMTEAFKE